MSVRTSRGRRHNLGDGWLGWSLRLYVSDEHVLDKSDAGNLLDHHHDLRGIAVALERTHRDIDDLAQNVIKDTEWLLLHIVQDQVSLVLRTRGGISNARSQSSVEEIVEGVELCQEVLSLRRVSFNT
jgi:hypothetical protein